MDDRAVMTAADFGAPTPDADPIAETAVVTPEDFGAAAPVDYFTQWIGPRPKADLRSLNNGSDYIRLQDKNMRGRAGFLEGITPDESAIPFAGSVLDAARIGKLVFTAKKLTNGEEVDDQSLLDMNLFLAESDREANAKWTGKLGRGLKDLVTFGTEIVGTTLAVASLGGAAPGIAAEAEALAGKAAVKMGKIELRQYIFKAMQKRVEKKVTGLAETVIGRSVAKRLGASATKEAIEKEAAEKVGKSFLAKTAAGLAGVAAAGAATSGVKQGVQLAATGGETAGANERQLMATLTGKPEAYTTSLMYDMGDQFIEYMTEFSGAKMAGAVSDVAGKFGAKIPGRDFGKRMLDKLERTIGLDFVNKNKGLSPAAAARGAAATVDKMKWLTATGAYVGAIATREGVNVETAIRLAKSAGYDGIAEEWAEERLGGFLRGLTGIEGDEAGLRNAVDKMIPNLEDGLVEIATFATPIALITGLHGLQASKWAGGPGLDQLARDTNRMIALLKKQDNPTESASSAERDELTNLIEKHTKFYNSASNKTMAGKVLKLVEDISTLNFSGTEFGNLDRALGAANIQPVIKMWAEAREATIKSFQSAKPDLKLEQAEAQVDKLLRPYVRRFADSWRQTLSARALPGITEEEANTELQKAVAEGTVKFIKVGDNRIAVAESENLSSASDKMISVLKDLNVLLLQRGQSPLSMPTMSVNMSAEEYLNATSDMTSEENFDLMVRLNFGRLGSDNTWKQWRSVVKDTRGVAEKINSGLPVVGMTVGLVDNPDQALPTSFAKVTQVLEDGKVVLDQGMAANETFVSPRNYRISEGIELEFGRGSLSMGTRAELVKKYEEYTDGNDANFSLLYAREVSDDRGGKMKNAKGEQLYIVTNQGLSSFNRMFISLENKTSYDMVEELLHTGANLQSAAKNYGAKGAMSPLANQVVDQANAWFRTKLVELEAKGVRKLSEVERDLYDQVKAAVIATNPGSKARREFYHKMVGLKFAGFENDPRSLEVQWSGAIKALPVTAIQAPLVAQDLKGMFGPDYAQLFSREGFTMSIPEHQTDTRSGTEKPSTAPASTRSGTPAADSTLSGFPGSKPPAPTGPDSTLSGFPAAPSVGADINPVPEQPRQDKFMGGPEQPLRLPTAEELDARLKSKFTARPERLNREELESALSDALEEVFPTEDAQTEIEEDSTDGDTAMNDAANADAFARQQKSQFAPTVEAVGRRIQELNGGSALPVDAASSLTVVLQDLQPVLDPILMGTMPLDQQTEQLKAVLNDYRELGPESAMADLLHNAVISTLASQLQDGKMTIRGEGDKPAVTQLYNYYAGFQVMPAVTITIDENGAPRSSYIKNLTDPENGVVSFIHSRLDRMIEAEGGALALVEKFKKVLNASWSNTSGTLDVSRARVESAAIVLRELIGLPDHVFNNVLRPQPGGRTALTGFVFGSANNMFKQLGNRAPGMLDASVIQAADKEAATAEFLHTQLVDKMVEPGQKNAFSFIREMVSKTSYDALSLALRHKSEADGASQKDNLQGPIMLQGVQRLVDIANKHGGRKETISSMLAKLGDIRNDAGAALNGTQAVLYPGALQAVERFMSNTAPKDPERAFRNQDGTFGGWMSLPTFGENEQVYFVRTSLLPLDQAKAEYEAFYAKMQQPAPDAESQKRRSKISAAMLKPSEVTDNRVFLSFFASQNIFGSLENVKGLEDYFKRLKQLSTPGLGFNRDLNVYIDASKKWGKKFDGQWIFFPRAAQDFANFFHGGKFTGHMKAHIYDVQPGGPTRLIKVNGMNLTVLAPETGMQGLPEGETWDGVMAVPASLVDDPEMEDRGEFFRSLYKIAQANPNLDGIVFGDSGQKLGEKKFGAALQENGSLAGDLPNQIAAGMTVIPQKSFVMSQDLSDDTTPRMDRFARQGFFNQFGLPQSGLRVQLFNEMQDEMDKSFGFSLLDDTILKQKAEGGDASALRLVELLNAGVSPNSMGLVDKVQQRRMSMLNRLMEHASYRVRSVLSGNGDAKALTSMEIVDGKVKLGTMNSSSPGRYALRYASREAAIAAIKANPGWFVDMIDGLDLSQPVDWKTFQWSDKLSIREHEFREMVGFDENNKVMTYTVVPGEYNLTDRIPGDFMQSHVPLRLWVQLDPRMNVAMSDDLSQIRKGEDFDGDTMYQNMLVRLADGTTPADDSRWGKYNRILLSILQDLNPETAFAFQTEAEKFKEGWISALEAGNPELLAKSEKLKMFTFDTEHFFRNAYISGRKVLGVVARFNNMIGLFPELDVSFASDIKFGDIVLSLRPGTVTKDYKHLARFKQWVGTGLVNVAVDDPKKPRLYLAGLTGDSIGLMQAYLLGRWSSFATDAGAKQAVQDAVKFMRSPMVQRYVALSAQADFRNPMVARAMNREDIWATLAKEGFDDKSLKSLVEVKDALRDLSAVVVLATPGNKFADVRAMQKMQAKLAAFGEDVPGPLNLGKFSPEAKAIRSMASRFMGQAENIFRADISYTRMFAGAENWASSWYGADKGLTLPDRTPLSSRAFGLMHSRAKQAALIQSLHDKSFIVPTDDAAARSILAAIKASSPSNKFTKALAMAPGQPKFIVPEVRTDYLNDAFVKEMRAAFAQLTPRVQQYLGFLAAVWYGNNEGTRLGNYSVLFDDKFQKVRSDAQERIRRAWATDTREKVPVTLFDFLTLRSMPAYWPGATAEDHSRLLALNTSAAQAEKRTKLLGAISRMDGQKKKMKGEAKDMAEALIAELRVALEATAGNRHPGTAKISPLQIAAALDAAVNPERLAAEAQPGPQSRIEPPPVSLAPTSQVAEEPATTPSAPLRLITGTRPAAVAGGLPMAISFNVDAAGNVSNLKGIVSKGFKKWSPEIQKSWEGFGWTIRESKADASVGKLETLQALVDKFPRSSFSLSADGSDTVLIDGERHTGVTKAIGADPAFFFDREVIAERVAASRGVTKQEVLNEWEKTRAEGIQAHVIKNPVSLENAKGLGEFTIWDDKFVGVVDAIIPREDGSIALVDHKRWTQKKSQQYNSGLYGKDSEAEKDRLQLMKYADILTKAGFRVSGVFVAPYVMNEGGKRVPAPGMTTINAKPTPRTAENFKRIFGTDASIGQFAAGLALAGALAVGTPTVYAQDEAPSIDISQVIQTIGSNETAPVGDVRRLHPYRDRGFDGSVHMAIGPGVRLTPENWTILKPILGGTRASWFNTAKTITEEQLSRITAAFAMKAANVARANVPGYGTMLPEAQAAIADLVHWSIYPKKFPKSWKAMQRGDVREAVRQLQLNDAETGPSEALTIPGQRERLQRAIDALGPQIEAAPAAESFDPALDTSASVLGSNSDEIDAIARSMERAKRLKDGVKGDGSQGWAIAAIDDPSVHFGEYESKEVAEAIAAEHNEKAEAMGAPDAVVVPVSMTKFISYADVAKGIEAWKKAEGISYNPNEAYARGEAFYHDIGAFNPSAPGLLAEISSVLLAQSRLLRKGGTQWWEQTKNQLLVSGYTAPTQFSRVTSADQIPVNEFTSNNYVEDGYTFRSEYKRGPDGAWQSTVFTRNTISDDWYEEPEYSGHAVAKDVVASWNAIFAGKARNARPSSGLRFVIRPTSQDIVWAAAHDVYSGTVRRSMPELDSASGRDFDTWEAAAEDASRKYGIQWNGTFDSSPAWNGEGTPGNEWAFTALSPGGVNVKVSGTMGRKADGTIGKKAEWKAYKPDSTLVDPKAPSAQNLQSVADSIEAAIKGRTKYNEIGVRLRIGNFYIEGGKSKDLRVLTNRDRDLEGRWTAEVVDVESGETRLDGTGQTYATEAEARAAGEALSKEIQNAGIGIPAELRRLNDLLKKAYRIANGSLDAIPKADASVGDPKALAEKTDMVFNGTQTGIPDTPDQWVFTDNRTKSTMYVPAGSSESEVLARRDEMRKRFATDASIGPRINDMAAAYPGQTREWHDLAAKLPGDPRLARQLARILDPSRTEPELNDLVAAATAVPRQADQPVSTQAVRIEDGGMRAYLNGRFHVSVGAANYDLSTLAIAIKRRKLKKAELSGIETQDAQRELQAVLNNVFQIGSPERQAEAIISFTNSVAKLAPSLTKPMAALRAHVAQFLIERDHGWVPGELWVATDLADRINPAVQEDINRTSASIAGFSAQEDLFSDPFIHGGNLSMHQALLKGMREINALKQEAIRYVMMKKKLYGIGPDNKVFQVEDAEGFDLANDIPALRGTSRKYRRFLDDRIGGLFKKGRYVLKATLTEDQAFDVQLFMDASGALLETLNTPGLDEAQAIANAKIPVQKNVLPVRLHSLVRQQPRPQTEDEILLNAPKPPPAEYLAASDLMALWRQSDARKILADAGRTEQELDPVALAREMREKFNATREHVNQVLASTFRDQPYLRYRLNYMPHVFGNGLMGPDVRKIELELEAAARGAEAQEVKNWETRLRYTHEGNAAVMRDPAPEQIYEVLKRARYRDLKALSPTDPQLVARMQAGEFAKFGLEPGFTYANVSLHLKRLVENELISTALGRKPWQDPSTAATPVPVSELNKSDIALLHHLRTAVGNFKSKEYSNRAYARSYDTYMDAWLDRYWLPKSMSPVDTYHRYAVDVYTTALNKSLISKFILQRDVDGIPLVVPRVSRVYREEGVVPKEVWREVLKNLSTAYGKPVDLNGDVGAQINAIIDEFIEPKKGRDWVEVESPFASVVKFHVQKTGGGVLENMVGGETAGILKQLTEDKKQWFVGDYDVLKGLMHANAWMKSNSVGFSLFFPFSTGESVIAGTGLKKNILYYNTKTGYSAPFGRAFKENIREMMQLREMMRNNAPQMSEFANFMERTGLSFDFANVSEGVVGTVEKDIESMSKRVELAMGAKAAENFKKVMGANNQWSRTLFGDLFPTIKVWATHRIFMQMKAENPSVSDTEIMQAIAPMMDAAYGGIEWERFAWATPRFVQAMNLSLFAPIWTFAAWNIAGGGLLTGRILKNYMSPQFKKFVFTQNWPAMMALVLFGIPNAVQFLLWASMGGDPDDTPFASLNEDGKGGVFPSIDLTPLVRRMPNYTGEQTGKRRVYARFGKQSFEVIDGWLKEPLNTLLRKLSQPAKLVFEQVTGTSPGSEWNLEFRGRGMMGWVEDKNGDFLGSRAGYALQKFLPMSIVQAVKNPATVPFNFVVPTSKGMSLGTASHMLEQIMWTYANEDTWSLVKVNPEYKTRLASLAPEVLDAAERNGVNPDKVVATAKGAVLGKLYGEFYEALNQNDIRAMERISYRILRVNGSLDGIQRSVTNRDKQYGRTDSRTPEQQEAIEAAFK